MPKAVTGVGEGVLAEQTSLSSLLGPKDVSCVDLVLLRDPETPPLPVFGVTHEVFVSTLETIFVVEQLVEDGQCYFGAEGISAFAWRCHLSPQLCVLMPIWHCCTLQWLRTQLMCMCRVRWCCAHWCCAHFCYAHICCARRCCAHMLCQPLCSQHMWCRWRCFMVLLCTRVMCRMLRTQLVLCRTCRAMSQLRTLVLGR